MNNNVTNNTEPRTAVLVDCDNVSPEILEYALLMAAQFGRIALRRGYGNYGTLANKWRKPTQIPTTEDSEHGALQLRL